jgi:uncharacterized protein (DUF362 family)
MWFPAKFPLISVHQPRRRDHSLATVSPMRARVAIVDDSDLPPAARLAAALEHVGFWHLLADGARAVIKPELAGFTSSSPCITDPALVEALIDLLHDHGCAAVAVVGTADSSALWADNRDIYALADLLGYRFVTPGGRAYDLIDLADTLDHDTFPPGSILHRSGLSPAWRDADIRIVFSKNRTDETSGYALCLDTLIGVLPLSDKDLHYRRRRHSGDVISALLDVAPPHLCLIDAITSAHGLGGQRAPVAIDTGTIVAATDAVLADYVGALKMDLDPGVSPLFARVTRRHAVPLHAVTGSLAPLASWVNVPEVTLRITQSRHRAGVLDRLVAPWLQCLDAELFPLKHPLDARMNATIAPFFAERDTLLTAANAFVGLIGQTMESYRTLFDKDALHRASVPLGIDTDALPDDAFDALVEELRTLEPVALAAAKVSEELRWRYVEGAVVFSYRQYLPIDFTLFTRQVDVARTIQFMNDYLGGVVLPLVHDASGRPIRQAERNIYLPQPNYLVLYQGKPIDVSKLEVVEYAPECHRLYWKTIASENASATYDDGIATFERAEGGTRVTFIGRQQFTLPLFWQVFDLDLIPEVKSHLVTHAYQTFFDRTLANFEALVEGREIRIGRPADEPASLPAEQLMPLLEQIGEAVAPMLQRATQLSKTKPTGYIDEDGFTPLTSVDNSCPDEPAGWINEVARFVAGLSDAIRRDMVLAP